MSHEESRGLKLAGVRTKRRCPARRQPVYAVSARVHCRRAAVLLSLAVGLVSPSAFAVQNSQSASALQSEQAELTVHVQGDEGVIFLDGREVGQGSFSDVVTSGRHELKVTRPGYEDQIEILALRDGEVHSMGVTLRLRVTDDLKSADGYMGNAPAGGVYGGVQLIGMLEPNGSGTSMETSCDTLGATSCTPGSVLGGALSGYVGFFVDPVGLELSLMVSGDSTDPAAVFDGTSGADINPVVAVPARTESFLIARFGGGAALRVRVIKRVGQVDFSFAAGPGLMYRVFAMTRDTVSRANETAAFADAGASYFSPYLSMEASVGLKIGETTAISLGLVSWIEHAGDEAESRAEDLTAIRVGSNDFFPQATPAYDLASGAQWFLGPVLGLSFGQ